jgi:hypothetical protein
MRKTRFKTKFLSLFAGIAMLFGTVAGGLAVTSAPASATTRGGYVQNFFNGGNCIVGVKHYDTAYGWPVAELYNPGYGTIACTSNINVNAVTVEVGIDTYYTTRNPRVRWSGVGAPNAGRAIIHWDHLTDSSCGGVKFYYYGWYVGTQFLCDWY